jgi:hypothetical protein
MPSSTCVRSEGVLERIALMNAVSIIKVKKMNATRRVHRCIYRRQMRSPGKMLPGCGPVFG